MLDCKFFVNMIKKSFTKRLWISEKIFTDIITISQMTPGLLAVNTSTFVGLQVGEIIGALAATTGCIFCGIIISLALYKFFQTHQKSVYVLEVLNGLKSASLGLIIFASFMIILLALYDSSKFEIDFLSLNWIALLIFLTILIILRKWKPNPIMIIFISGIAGFIFYR